MTEQEVNSMISSNDPAIRQAGYTARESFHFGEGWLTDACEQSVIACRGCNETMSPSDLCANCFLCKGQCCEVNGCVGKQLKGVAYAG